MPGFLTREEEVRLLHAFLADLEHVLQSVAWYPLNIVPGSQAEALRDAWNETVPAFGAVHSWLEREGKDRLPDVGLTGSRLAFELAVFDRAHMRLLDHAPEIFGKPWSPVIQGVPAGATRPEPSWAFLGPLGTPVATPAKREGFWRRLARRLGKSLEAADVIVGSIALLFPPADGIHQMKEAVDVAVAYRRTRRR